MNTMKKGIFPCGLLIFIYLALGCSAPSTESRSDRDQAGKVENDLPDMRIRRLDQSEIDIKKLSGKVVLIFFFPECDHCQREASQISQSIAAFNNVTLYFITSDTAEKTEGFANDYLLNDLNNVVFGNTSAESVLKNFGPIDTPSIYIYSAEQKLVKAFNGEVSISEVLKYI
jgi:peroxiredoxin